MKIPQLNEALTLKQWLYIIGMCNDRFVAVDSEALGKKTKGEARQIIGELKKPGKSHFDVRLLLEKHEILADYGHFKRNLYRLYYGPINKLPEELTSFIAEQSLLNPKRINSSVENCWECGKKLGENEHWLVLTDGWESEIRKYHQECFSDSEALKNGW